MFIDKNLEIEKRLKAFAKEQGLSDIAIASPNSIKTASKNLKIFLDNGYQGQMDWLLKRSKYRSDPKKLWSDVKSVIVVSDVYTPKFNPMHSLSFKNRGNISVYAHGKDYHDVVKKKLKKIGNWLIENIDGEIKIFVDTAPVMEKPLAQAAGLGWQGKHTNLVSKKFGNWFFLGIIFSNVLLKFDEPEFDRCGSCQECLKICPTKAFIGPYKLDARKCISYLTIEHRGPVDIKFRKKLGNRIYGCDDCLAVCPWNKFAKKSLELNYFSKKQMNLNKLEMLSKLDDSNFRNLFSGSPIKRIGRDRFIRNVLYAIGNSNDKSLFNCAYDLTNDHSFQVRDAAVWAINELIEKK
tara:strand:+ start:1293 stop:2345 length:1053 start_codon:yes stop_codon:yes gene_type:complete